MAACELSYTWRSDGNLLHQHQTLILLDSDEEPGARQALGFIGTCPKAFTSEWTQKYEAIIASVKLRKPTKTPPPFATQAVGSASRGPLFMFSSHDGKLNQFPHAQSLYEFCAVNAIAPDLFQFFGPAGQPLVMAAPPANTRDGWTQPRSGQALLLWTTNPADAPTLLSLLPSVRHLVGLGTLRNVESIETYLRSLKA